MPPVSAASLVVCSNSMIAMLGASASFSNLPEARSCCRTFSLFGCSHGQAQIAIPDIAEPRVRIRRKGIVHQFAVHLLAQLAIQLVEELILGLEIGEKRAFCYACGR